MKNKTKDKPLYEEVDGELIVNEAKLKRVQKFIREQNAKLSPKQRERIVQLGIKYGKERND